MKSLTNLTRRSLAFGIALCLFQSAQATLFYTEGFNYTPGNLSGNDSWLGGSGQLQVGSANLTYSGLADAANPGNDLLVNQGAAGSMTVNFNGSAITSGSIYYSFLAEATTLPTANSYLTDLLPTGGTPNGSGDPLAVYVGQQVAGSQFKIGVRHSGEGSGATYTSGSWAVLNQVNFFVVEYTFVGPSADTVSLFVNPTPGGSQPTADVTLSAAGTDAANLQAIGFKANSGTSAGNWTFDTLRVGDTWADVTPAVIPEPSAVALLGFGLLGLAVWRRVRC
jgi:hypothetical protein